MVLGRAGRPEHLEEVLGKKKKRSNHLIDTHQKGKPWKKGVWPGTLNPFGWPGGGGGHNLVLQKKVRCYTD